MAPFHAIRQALDVSLPRRLGFLLLFLFTSGLLSGCASVKQYSIDSWQGPLPLHDMNYVQADP